MDLGDITQNSWAVSTKLEPKEVMYYKVRLNRKIGELWQQSLLAHVPSNTSYLVLHPDQFTGPKTKGPFTISDTKNFFLGLYVPPGEKEKDFKFFVGIWGMSNETMECRRWGQGWGENGDTVLSTHTHIYIYIYMCMYVMTPPRGLICFADQIATKKHRQGPLGAVK